MQHLQRSLLIAMLLATSAWAGMPPLTGDFNNDGMLDCADIDPLIAEIAAGTNNLLYDLTGDNLVDLADRDEWLRLAGAENTGCREPYLLGDCDLSGSVDQVDLNIVNANLNITGTGWCGGDVNADGITDGADLIVVEQNQGRSSCGPLPVEQRNWGAIKARFGQ